MVMTSSGPSIRAPATAPPGRRLETSTAAVRVSFTWLGVRKTLSPGQKAQAAQTFNAEGRYLSAAKKLLDTRHPAFQAVTAIRGRILSLWRGLSLPFPDPGIRLIRRDQIETFNDQMTGLKQDLAQAVAALDRQYDEMRQDARQRLGELYNGGDYPPGLRGLFEVTWEFPSVEPPAYLLQLNPELFAQERQRIAARFDEAVMLAEQAFSSEFAKLVAHLTERLSGEGVEGKAQVFRDSAVTNLREFFERFKNLNVHSNPELDHLVEVAQQAVQGISAQDLRDRGTLRTQVVAELGQVQSVLDTLLVDRPRRKILRPSPRVGPASAQAVA